MTTLLTIAALGEVATSLVLVVYPPIVLRLLLGGETAGVGIVASRIAGISLAALGVACWPGTGVERALYAMLMYSSLVTLYLIRLGFAGEGGSLLWPAAAAHGLLSVLLGRACYQARRCGAVDDDVL